MKINEIISKIETFAPPELAAEWDNSGWQIRLEEDEINTVLLCLSPTANVIEQAIEKKCNLIISHHPLMFSKFNKLSMENYTQSSVIKAVQNHVQVYSAHTNLDRAEGGIAHVLAGMLKLKNICFINDFVIKGELETPQSLQNISLELKTLLKTSKLKLINHSNKQPVSKIAVCPGSGGDLTSQIKDVDLYITGDVKYHTAIEAANFAIIDAGHFETERVILPVLKKLLDEFKITVYIADEKEPWEIV